MIGWLDCTAGASGDMLLGAFVGAGANLDVISSAVDALGVGPITFTVEQVLRHAIVATRVHVDAPLETAERSYASIRSLLDASDLHDQVRILAQRVFARLARAEATVHGTAMDDVHFHEVGALDSLADVIGVCAAYVDLGSPVLTCSPVAVGFGLVITQHGTMPVPVPAVLGLCAEAAIPIESGSVPHEACTPTAAALIAELCTAYGPLPAMTPARTGVGAGGRDPLEAANVSRLILGAAVVDQHDGAVVLEANVDDQDPRLWPTVIDTLLRAGASDAWITPIVMKKGRPAYTLHVLCQGGQVDELSTAVFAHTTTIGLRVVPVGKRALQRRQQVIDLDGHEIGVKIATQNGHLVNLSVEFEDVRHAAERLGRPLKEVMARATAVAWGKAPH